MDWIASEWASRELGLEASAVAPGSAEIEALGHGALLVPLPDSRLLRLTGADRVDFLHGQVSNEVRGLRTGQVNRSLLLNHKGHALADMSVFRGNDELQVLVDGGGLDQVEDSLRRHIIFDQVELVRSDAIAFTLQGPAAGVTLSQVLSCDLPAAGEFVSAEFDGRQVTVATSGRTQPGGFDLLIGEDGARKLVAALIEVGAVPGSRPALELGRVRAGVASAAGEAGDGVLPQEAGLEPLVSYHKGCYLGQEIMARIEARGKMRRELAALRLEGLPADGVRDIESGGKRVGRLGTVVLDPQLGYLALAVLRGDLAADAELVVDGVSCYQVPLPDAGSAVPG